MIARFAFAVLATLLILPCLGFGAFGLLHAWGESTGWGAVTVYAVLDLILLGAVVVIWWSAFMVGRTSPGHCPGCDYSLGDGRIERCPECGRSTGWTPEKSG